MSADADVTQLGMCPATLLPDLLSPSEDDIARAVDATVEVGCTEVSVWASHVPLMGDLSAQGLHVQVLEGAQAWANGSRAEAEAEADEFSALAAQLGAPLIMAFVIDPELADWDAAQTNLRHLVTAAEGIGARVCLEFLPFGGIPDLASAWRMVEPLGPAATLTIDTWHWTRQAGGPAPDLLSTIPGERIAYVQISDVSPVPAEIPMLEAGFGRLLPGDGVADFHTFLDALWSTGAHPFIAPEVFSQDLVNDLGPVGAAKASLDATRTVLHR
ncbi:MAG TPA: sugar phosphate isomerase/epimerase [Acidimicrobiales bacterium]|nr:sugar phosphate isomerase/epimerase [Acidimicrobiales bacterium]